MNVYMTYILNNQRYRSMIYFFEDNNYFRNENGSASYALLGITQSEFEKSITDHSVGSVDILEIDDNFGIHFTAKVTLINPHKEPNDYLLTSNRHQVLYYESIDNLVSALHDLGYDPPKADLNIHTVFSGF